MNKNVHAVKDPVCGMELKSKAIQARSDHQGKTYYFCSSMCKEQFEADPKSFAQKEVA